MKFIKLILFTIILCVTGCDDSKQAEPETSICGDLSSLPTEFDITDVGIQVLIAPEPKIYPKWVVGDLYNENTEVIYNDVIFSIDSITQIIASKKEKNKRIFFSFISSAYACSPIPPSTNEKIVDIKITSSGAFNSTLTTGDPLTSKFNVVYADSETDFYGYEDGVIAYYTLNQYLEQDDVYAGNTIQLKLTEAPEFSGTLAFFIELMLDTGEVFTLETPEISFTKL
jgi:hypothetical protein